MSGGMPYGLQSMLKVSDAAGAYPVPLRGTGTGDAHARFASVGGLEKRKDVFLFFFFSVNTIRLLFP